MRQILDDCSVVVQQKVSGTGTFTGVPLGYARYNHIDGSASLWFRAQSLGTTETYRVVLVDTGRPQAKTTARWDADNLLMIVVLARTTAIIATAADVVTAINGVKVPYGAQAPVVAGLVTDATLSAGLAAATLVGGIEPTDTQGGIVRLDGATNASGGLFYFDQTRPWILRSVTGTFPGASGTLVVTVSIANVTPGLNAVTNETHRIYTVSLDSTSGYSFNVAGPMLGVVLPGQAVVVTANALGTVRCAARSESKLSQA